LRRMKVWPTSTRLAPNQISQAAENHRSDAERKQYALGIWNTLYRSNGRRFAPMVLQEYLNKRGIDNVPTPAMATLPIAYSDSEVLTHDPGMVLPIRNHQGTFQGIHVTWLNANMTAKRDQEPQRQCYGLLRDNFVVLTKIDYANPPETLLIGEGVETVLTAMQLTGLPGIASSGWWNMVYPPRCAKYIILADNGDAGRRGAKQLAEHLQYQFPDATVQIATPDKPEGGKKGYDWNDALVDAIANRTDTATLGDAILNGDADHDDDRGDDGDDGEDDERKKQTDLLTELGSQSDLFRTTDDDTTFADIQINGHRETWAIKSKGFERWLRQQFYKATKKGVNSTALSTALSTLDAMARYEGAEREVALRVAGHDGKIYLDLCDAEWRVVEIDNKGWRLVDNAPVRFFRRKGMKPLPLPVEGGKIETLKKYINVKDRADFVLVVSWLLAALNPRGPYPVLDVTGEAGSAKSTLLALLRNLVDPNKTDLRAPPREERDLFIAAGNSWVLSYDNLSWLPDWQSDAFARLATGGGLCHADAVHRRRRAAVHRAAPDHARRH
jgi:Toprim domain